jgi:hypothetical protein
VLVLLLLQQWLGLQLLASMHTCSCMDCRTMSMLPASALRKLLHLNLSCCMPLSLAPPPVCPPQVPHCPTSSP